MSMEINNTYSGYAVSNDTSATQTKACSKVEADNRKFSNVAEYTRYLQQKYSYMNTGTTSMQGVPTTVSVSGAFLKKCMNDPEKAKYLEENLKAIPDCMKSLVNYTRTMPGSPVMTYSSYTIDENGNITWMGGCTNDPDGKIARENAKRKAEEKKAAEEKTAKKRAEKNAEEEIAAERRIEKQTAKQEAVGRITEGRKAGEYIVTVTDTNVKNIMRSVITRVSGIPTASISGFDRKA